MKILTEEEAFARLSAQCATAEHCAHEINEKMVRWQLDDDIRKRIIQRLTEERYIDERRYCRAFTADKLRYNKWGRHKIAQALAMKHIDRTLVNEALDGIDEEEYFFHNIHGDLDRASARASRLPTTTNCTAS